MQRFPLHPVDKAMFHVDAARPGLPRPLYGVSMTLASRRLIFAVRAGSTRFQWAMSSRA